jgi:hypothetical protein
MKRPVQAAPSSKSVAPAASVRVRQRAASAAIRDGESERK